MLFRALPAALAAAALLPATASAATIAASPTQAGYDAAAGETTRLLVISGFETAFAQTAVFFNPLTGNSVFPTTSDADCIARTSGGSSCRLGSGTTIRLDLVDQDDLVNVGAAGNLVEVHLGGGADRAFTTASRLEAHGEDGDDELSGFTGLDLLDGGPGDDTLAPYSFGDSVIGGTGVDTVLYGGTSPVAVTLDGVADDGVAGQQQNVAADVEAVRGGEGPDDLTGNDAANTLRGGEGGDTLQGGGGADALLGEGGNDLLRARDGGADTLDCGPGEDTVVADVDDVVDADCETVTLPDDDGDGVHLPFDCDDGNPAIRPGAAEVAGDGVDQDCTGTDLPGPEPDPVDPRPVDPGPVGPGPVGGPGPAGPGPVDPGGPLPPARVDARVLARWGLGRAATVILQLDVRDVPAGGKVALRCKGEGCPFSRRPAKVERGVAKAGKHFAGARLAPGTRLQVRVTAPGMTGKVVRYTFRAKRRLPVSKVSCLAPGASRPSAC